MWPQKIINIIRKWDAVKVNLISKIVLFCHTKNKSLNSWRYQFHTHHSTHLLDLNTHCRWSAAESLIFVKYDHNHLNILDAENKTLTLKSSIELENLSNCNDILFFLFCKIKFFTYCMIGFQYIQGKRTMLLFLKANWGD